MHGHSLLLVSALALVSDTQVAELTLGSVFASDDLPEEGARLASALEVQNGSFAVWLWPDEFSKCEGSRHRVLWGSP